MPHASLVAFSPAAPARSRCSDSVSVAWNQMPGDGPAHQREAQGRASMATADPILPLILCFDATEPAAGAAFGHALTELRDGEALRLLPPCGHAFHRACIDLWFPDHDNCPNCRATVQLHHKGR
ncbi:hypothetical protein PR202_ga29252 [Eleusine coracana subsp. coracana]|uniref:RING-type domain-containing protein n=1 Tax=Eleusine coracana subsp. coracana TaxID=191504 RepID=A0AAV5DKX1_ELECO|nr:hypothetical protein PR202_ga29252 [Eleusine coracana subsp. coracana]